MATASKKKTKIGRKKVSEILTLSDISAHLAEGFDIPKSHAKAYMTEMMMLVTTSLKKGRKVRLSGLGILQVKKRAARKGRNPKTGEALRIKASKRVAISTDRGLKESL
jgi:DNA-binding protein HU-beta